jgi:hypothetical protein
MSKVMKSDATLADAFARFNFSSQSEVWVTFRFALTAAAFTDFDLNAPSGELVRVFDGAGGAAALRLTNGPVWQMLTGPGGILATAPATDTWQTVEFHYKSDGTTDLYVDGVLLGTHTSSGTGNVTSLFLGQRFTSSNYATAVVYFDDVLFGTTRGASDLFSDDFEGGDLSAWTSTSGDVSVVDDPFAPVIDSSVVVLDRPVWKFIVADLRTTRTLTAITTLMSDTTVERVLAESWPATATVPADDPRVRTVFEGDTFDEPFLAEGVRTLIGFRNTGTDPLWEVAYTGLILQVNDAVEDGIPLSHLSAWDVRKYLEYLPVCKADGTLPGKKGLTFTATKANEIARALLTNLYAGSWGDLLTILLNTTDGVDEDCAELDITFQQGTTIADAWAQLEHTGTIDIILTPFYDPHAAPGVISVLNTYAEAGQERPAAIFGWDRSPRSLTGINRLEDGTKRANVIQYFDPTATPSHPPTTRPRSRSTGPTSRSRPSRGRAKPQHRGARTLQKDLRKNGQTVVGIDPTAQRAAQPVQGYDIGDRIRIEASELIRKPISGFARIYRIPIGDRPGRSETVTSLGISADGIA